MCKFDLGMFFGESLIYRCLPGGLLIGYRQNRVSNKHHDAKWKNNSINLDNKILFLNLALLIKFNTKTFPQAK